VPAIEPVLENALGIVQLVGFVPVEHFGHFANDVATGTAEG
jgi:hypothetical protein